MTLDLDISPQFAEALDLLENSKDSLFVTGRAGTGKSTLLTHFRKISSKNVVLLAPTGVAAVNIGGATIHSFFGFRPDVTMEKAWDRAGKVKKPELYQNLEAIVIDEISMVRADLLDCVDAFMRHVCHNNHPFGGVRVIFFGDLYQLPPVVSRDEEMIFHSAYRTPFFFSAEVMSRVKLKIIVLEHIYRQNDPEFIGVLNAIRENKLEQSHLNLLNTRVSPDYAPPPEEYVIHLTGTNRDAESYNQYQLQSLEGDIQIFQAQSTGKFDARTEPAPRDLQLKFGAQVMLTCNDPGRRFINGTVGRIEDMGRHDRTPYVSVRLQNGKLIDIEPNEWEMYNFLYNADTKKIESEVAGTYTQLPLILAWSITIHKSQGKTFDRVIIDLPRSFAHGQTYVALSRATSLSGIFLRRPLTARHVIMDPVVTTWLSSLSN
jgi:ATP-dependent exoDNAse (exonuclease V) alpha subunit